MSRVAYQAGPIDQANPNAPWREVDHLISFELRQCGFDVFRPSRAWDCGPRSGGVQTVNDAVIDVCQLLVAHLPVNVPTLGTPVEIETALRRRIPVLIVTGLKHSIQVAKWAERGAVVCRPDELGAGLLEVCHTVEERRTSSVRESIRRATGGMRQLTAPAGLIFEPVASDETGDLTDSINLPTRAYADDAGLDLYVTKSAEIPPHSFVDVSAGVKVDIPHGYFILIQGRSSTLRKRHLLVNPGVIDAGWTGPLFAGVYNMGDEVVKVEAGDRLAQAILLPAPVVNFRPEWGTVARKERGEKGFGSSGS